MFTADDGIAYLFADGKNGTHGVDEMEQRIVGVVGIAIAELPALVEARQRMQAAEQDSQQRAGKASASRRRASSDAASVRGSSQARCAGGFSQAGSRGPGGRSIVRAAWTPSSSDTSSNS